jgi:predicted CXXCH cytochrome family protein
MKKSLVFVSVFLFLGLCFAQETLVIEKLSRVYPPLKFTHDKHMEIAEGDCKRCHHFSGDKTPPCWACHTAEAQKVAVPLREAYHGLCTKCHKEMAGPVSCKECHGSPVKKYETLSISTLSKLYEPVDFPHGRHIEAVKVCKECHHMEEGRTYNCSSCHTREDVYRYEQRAVTIGLKGAYHGSCLSCHRKTGKGPLKCTACHKRRAKR